MTAVPEAKLSTYEPKDLSFLPGKFPPNTLPDNVDPHAVAEGVMAKLQRGLDASLFTEEALWRDQFAMCGTLRTFYGHKRIMAAWNEIDATKKAHKWTLIPQSAMVDNRGDTAWVMFRAMFETQDEPRLENQAFVQVVPDPENKDNWLIWMLNTMLENIVGHAEKDLRKLYPDTPFLPQDEHPKAEAYKPNGHANGANGHTSDTHRFDGTVIDALVVGGAQSGLALGGWFKALDLSYLIIDKFPEIGDSWMTRYRSVKLHTSQRFNDLPFGPTWTLETDPLFLPAASLARGYRRYARRYEIDLWTSTLLEEPATYDEKEGVWTAKLNRDGEKISIKARHIVLACGPGGMTPLVPQFPGQDSFKGTLMHSSEYQNSDKWKGLKGVVVGSANTGHDVTADMIKAGCAEVTMVQRSPTYVVPYEYFVKMFDMVWNDYLPGELSDRFFWAAPTSIARAQAFQFFNPLVDSEPERYKKLQATGFQTDLKGDFIQHLFVRFGGHYMDVGCSQMIADGKAKVKSGVPLVAFNQNGVEFADGSKIEADVVVFATGFDKDIKLQASHIIGAENANKLDHFWGVDTEGEISGAFKPCGVPRAWLTGGGCCHARYFTRFIALQIKADVLGKALPVYSKLPSE